MAKIEIGTVLRRRPSWYTLRGEDQIPERNRNVPCRVIYIHPTGRWCTVEYPYYSWGVFGDRLERPLRETAWAEELTGRRTIYEEDNNA